MPHRRDRTGAAEDATDDGSDIVGGHRPDAPDVFIDRGDVVPGGDTSAQPGHASAAVLEAEQHRALEVAERYGMLFVGDAVGDEAREHIVGDVEQFAESVDRSAGVHDERPCVAVGRRGGEHGVGQPAFLTDLLEEPTRHSPTENMVGHPHRVSVIVTLGERRPTNCDMHLLDRVVDHHEGTDRCRGTASLRGLAGRTTIEQSVDGGEDLCVLKSTGRRHDSSTRAVPLRMERRDVVAGHGLDGVVGAEGLASEGVIGIQTLVERGDHEIIGGVLAHEEFLDDDIAFGIEFVLPERRFAHHIGEQLETIVQFRHGQPQVIRRMLTGGVGVHLAAHGIDSESDRSGRTLLGAFEEQMLEEMRSSGDLAGFVA